MSVKNASFHQLDSLHIEKGVTFSAELFAMAVAVGLTHGMMLMIISVNLSKANVKYSKIDEIPFDFTRKRDNPDSIGKTWFIHKFGD